MGDIGSEDAKLWCTGDVGGELKMDSLLMDSVFEIADARGAESRGAADDGVNTVGELTSPGVNGTAEEVAIEDCDWFMSVVTGLGNVACEDTLTRRESSKNENRRVTFWPSVLALLRERSVELRASKERLPSSLREARSPGRRGESLEKRDRKLVFRERVVHCESGRSMPTAATFRMDAVYCTTS